MGKLVEIDCGSLGSSPWALRVLMTNSNMWLVRFSLMKLSGPLVVLCLTAHQDCRLTNGHGGWIYHVVTEENKTIHLCWQIQYLFLWHYQDETVFFPNEVPMVPPPWTGWVMCSEQTRIWSPWCGERFLVLRSSLLSHTLLLVPLPPYYLMDPVSEPSLLGGRISVP